MRIGFYTNSYHPAINGVVRSIDIFRRELAALGHEVFVFCPADEVYVDSDPHILRYPTLLNYAPMDTRIAMPRSWTMDRRIARLNLDIIHSQHPIYIGYEAHRQARRNGIPLIFTYHSQYEMVMRTYLHWPGWVFRYVMQRLYDGYFDRCDCMITPTESTRQLAAKRMPHHQHLLRVLPTPMDFDLVRAPNPQPIREAYCLAGNLTFISVTRLGPEKNLFGLLDAFTLASKQQRGLCLILVGDGPSRAELQREIARRGLTEQVILTGMVPMDKVPNYLAAADAYVCSSLSETQGLALIEGMASGLPAAVMCAPGSADVIENGVNGLLTPAEPTALAEAMLRLANDAALRARLGAQARATIHRYDPRTVTRQLVTLYEETIAAHRNGPVARI